MSALSETTPTMTMKTTKSDLAITLLIIPSSNVPSSKSPKTPIVKVFMSELVSVAWLAKS